MTAPHSDLRPSGTSYPEQHPILISLAWCIGLLLVFVPLAVAKYKRSVAR